MLALVQPTSTQTAANEIVITVEYNPVHHPRFKFGTATGKSCCSIQGDARIKLVLTGAKYSPVPVLWSSSPLLGGAPPLVVQEGQTISFEVPEPLSYFTPWIFKLSVDELGGLNGVTSPDFFLVRAPALTEGNVPVQSLTLTYDPQDGDFELDNGMLLKNERVLVNTSYPLYIPITVNVASTSSLVVSAVSILWASGRGMPGVIVISGEVPSSLTVAIGNEGDAAGYGQGFRLRVQFDNGQEILSPDPILINATLGDGN